MQNNTTNPLIEYVRERDILKSWRISSASFWRWSKAPNFPKPKRIGRCTCWPAAELQSWLEKQGVQRHEK